MTMLAHQWNLYNLDHNGMNQVQISFHMFTT
jgi:hypothetical protein